MLWHFINFYVLLENNYKKSILKLNVFSNVIDIARDVTSEFCIYPIVPIALTLNPMFIFRFILADFTTCIQSHCCYFSTIVIVQCKS